MPRDGTELLKEATWRGESPDGYKTTLLDEDRLRELEDQQPDDGVPDNLTNTISDYRSYNLREVETIRLEVARTLSSFLTPERTLELPGTGMEMANDHITQFASYYKDDNETPSGTIKDARTAGPGDIVFTFASPEVYEEVSGTSQDSFVRTDLNGGEALDVVGDEGVDESNSEDASLELDDDEMMFFTGDYIDLSEGKSVITKIQWTDVDGESYGPDNGIFDNRLSGAHVLTAQGAHVRSTADLDAKIYTDGDAEIVPVAFYMGPGTKAPSLV